MRVVLLFVLIILGLFNCSFAQRASKEKRGTNYRELSLKWLQKNNLSLRVLPKANAFEITHDCESNPVLKQIKGDTTTFWIYSQYATTGDFKELKKWTRKESFGRTEYLDGPNEQGLIMFVSLLPRTFLVKHDSLFELTSFFKISKDSIDKAMGNFIQNRQFDLAEKIITENHYKKFDLIFHPKMFNERKTFDRKTIGDKITLEHTWRVSEKMYYEIAFNNENNGTIIKFPKFLFDDKYRFLNYNGCNQSEVEQLTKDAEIE
jgi:hypothetical protein